MSFVAGRAGVRVPFSYMGSFADLSYEEALQLAKKRLEQLPSMYGQDMTQRELEFAMGGLQGDVLSRWTPYQMWVSPYISQGPEEDEESAHISY